MKQWNSIQWGAFASASLIASMLILPNAKGELVLDESSPNVEVISSSESSVADLPAPETERSNLRQKIQLTQPEAQAQVQQIQVQPEAEPKLTQSELLRRKRMRQELQNEDALQTRLEELRLKKEQELSGQIMGGAGINAQAQSAPAQPQVQVVSDQLTSVQAAPAPGNSQVQVAPVAVSSAEEKDLEDEKKEERMQVSISPRFGIANIQAPAGYQVNGQYSLGAGVVFGFSDHFAIEGGYTYSEYGVNIASANPFVSNYQFYFNNGMSPNRQTLTLKQNVGDAGLRVYLLGRKSKVRPYVAGGMGYSASYVNYDARIQAYLRQIGYGNSLDYEYNQYLGYLGAGLDIQMSDSISITGSGKYYSVLSATENSNLNNVAFFAPGIVNPSNFDKAQTAGTLSRQGFYTLHLGMSFTF